MSCLPPLEQHGFQVNTTFTEGEDRSSVNPDYVMRICDNITSNIVKYADPAVPVEISTVIDDTEVGFLFRNRKRKLEKKEDSSQIGVQNIISMMGKMKGRCEVIEDEEWYEIQILFPVSR